MRRLLPAGPERDRGLVIPIVALLLPVLILMVAFAIDLGIQRSNRRTMQARADIVALDLARLADGRTLDEIMAAGADPAYLASLNASADRNEVPVSALTVQFGTWNGTTFTPVVDPDAVPTAVRVTATQEQDYFFQPGSGSATREAVAALGQPEVDLTVGSVAAGFQPSVPNSASLDVTVTALNARLAAQFGATVPNPGSAGFDLAGYRGLAVADVDLARVASNAGFASPNELAASDITVGRFFDATATALDQEAADGDPNAANAAAELRRFRTQMGVNSAATMRLGETFQASQGGAGNAAGASTNVLGLLTGGAEVINGVNLISFQLNPGVPGVTSATVQQFLVQKAETKTLRVNGTAENRQARFQLDLQVAPLAGMSQPVRIPLVVEAAVATGTVLDLLCTKPQIDSEALIRVVTSGLTVRLGTAVNLATTSPGPLAVNAGVLIQGGGLTVQALLNLGLNLSQILSLNLANTTTGTASASLLGDSQDLVFTPFVDPPAFQRAPGGVGAVSLGAQLSSSLSASLGSSVLSSTATNNLVSQLAYVFDNLDALIVGPLLAASGVAIAGADVLADHLKCEGTRIKLVG